MKALIFGANGQDGYYLSKICDKRMIEVLAVSRSGDNIIGDVSDNRFVEKIIKHNKPEYIFHVAARSTTHHSALFENHDTISTGTLNILESVYKHSNSSKVFITGSGVQFVNNGKPINESSPFEPNSPYSISRIHSVYASRYYRSLGIKTYVGYLFHHESPLRKAGHMSQNVISAVRNIKEGHQKYFEVGDISVNKEWGFAGDIAEGIFRLIDQEEIYEAVIGTGKGYTIQKWIEICFSKFGLKWQDHVKIISGFIPEYPTLLSDPSLINRLGWKPKISISELADMMIQS